jgi:putative nucleotidyltransferase with HDIG domain
MLMTTRDASIVLVVHGNAAWRALVADRLTVGNCKALLAATTAEAIELMRHIAPRAVVCDLNLPDNGATAIVAAVRACRLSPPVILTGSQESGEGRIAPNSSGVLSPEEQANAETIALQVAGTLSGDTLSETINRTLLDLHIVSSYSEKLMGVIDRHDVLRLLFQTIIRHFGVDFMGFLTVQRRTLEFLYWSRYMVDDTRLRTLSAETVAVYNQAATTDIRRRRTVFTPIEVEKQPSSPLDLPGLDFCHTAPLCWDNSCHGVVTIGAAREPGQTAALLSLFSSLLQQTRIALTNTKLYSDMKENYIRTIKALAIAVDSKDTYTHGHSENVMNIADEIARELSVDESAIGSIRDAGLLHDIGKIGIPGYILNKPGPLTYEEFNGIMKTHSTLGANIVRDVPFLHDLYKLILYHHEHYDGKGYPEGLRGEQIPLGARILHVADAFEAMTSDRPYRNSLGKTEAIRRLVEGSGKQFDPAIIAAFLRLCIKKRWLDENAGGVLSPHP